MAKRQLTITFSKSKTTQNETAKTPEVNFHSTSEAREHKHEPDPENNSDITNPLIISLGFDCGPQIVIKEKAEISQPSFPFDSCITYKGVSEIISNGYTNLLDKFILSNIGSYIDFRNGIKFKHDGIIENKQGNEIYTQHKNKETTLEEVKTKYMRRLERLHKYLEAYNTSTNNQQIIFVRKSHDDNHHGEAREYDIEIKNDIVDTIELEGYLNSRYPKLNYLIVVFLICEDCFHNKKEGVDSILKDSKSTHIKYIILKKILLLLV